MNPALYPAFLVIFATVAFAAGLATAVVLSRRSRSGARGRPLLEHEREQQIGRALRSAFVPTNLPALPGTLLRGAYRGTDDVGGGWYDAFALGPERLGLTFGSVVGHGIEAATAMLYLRELLRAGLTVSGLPSGALATVDRELAARSTIASAFVAVLNLATGRLVFITAGHHEAVVVRSSHNEGLPPGALLGTLTDAPRHDCEVVLADGETLRIASDGVPPSIARDTVDPDVLVEALGRTWTGREVAVLALTVARTATATLAWRFTSDDAITADRARPAFVAYLAAHGVGGEALGAAEAVFGELVGNVVRHAPGPIDVDLRHSTGGYQLAVRDRGSGFVLQPPQLPDDMAESGRGLFLVATLGGDPMVRLRRGGGAEVSVLLRPTG